MRRWAPAAIAALAILAVAVPALGGSAALEAVTPSAAEAKKKPKPKVVRGPRGRRGPRGLRGLRGLPGAQGPAGPPSANYGAGAGLTLAGTVFSVDSSYVQRRVGHACAPSEGIRAIGADGSVGCTEPREKLCELVRANPATYPDATPACRRFALGTERPPDSARGPASSIAIATDGNPVLSYRQDAPERAHLAFCDDPGCLGQNEPFALAVSSHGTGDTPNSLALNQLGHPVVTTNRTPNGGLLIAICRDPKCGSQFIREPLNATAALQTSVAIGSDGKPVVAYVDRVTHESRILFCLDVNCDGTIVQILDSGTNTGWFPSLAIGADGHPVASFTQIGPVGALKVARCNTPDCFGFGASVSTIADGRGDYSSLAIGRDGNPVVSFPRPDGALAVVDCNDVACAGGGETSSVVDPGVHAAHTSIAIGRDGNPVISYFDYDQADLRFARCNDPACSGGDEDVRVLDSAGNVGSFSSLAIGIDGIPVISYADATNRDVKVIRVLDAA